MILKNRKAITLVEVLVTILIFTVMLEGVYVAFRTGNLSWKNYSERIVFKQETRRALVWLTRELREAAGLLVEKEKDGLTANFNRPGVGVVSYTWRKTGGNAFKIVRTQSDNVRILASNINRFTLTMPTNHEILIEIEAGELHPFTLKEKITIRAKTNLFRPAANDLL